MSNEDMEHRARRVSLYQSQKMNHDAISQLFDQEQKEALEQQEQRNRIIQETEQEKLKLIEEIEQKDICDTVIASKKYEILQQIQEVLKKDEKIYDDAEKLAYYLRKEYFDQIPPNSENTVIIIATQKGDKWAFHVQQLPDPIDLTKIKKIDIIMKED